MNDELSALIAEAYTAGMEIVRQFVDDNVSFEGKLLEAWEQQLEDWGLE